MTGAPDDDGGLAKRRIHLLWNHKVSAFVLHGRGEHERERKYGGVGIFGIGELGGLRDVLSKHKFGGNLWPYPGVLKRNFSRSPVRSVSGVSDGESPNLGIGHDAQTLIHINVGTAGNPEHNLSRGVLVHRSRLNESRNFESFWILCVG